MIKFSMAQEVGARPYQEDRMSYKSTPTGFYFAVFDGHGGVEAAEICARIFSSWTPQEASTVIDNLRFIMRLMARYTDMMHSGTTASIAHVSREGVVHAAVVGDSPILVRRPSGLWWQSPEHNVRTNMAEAAEAKKRGGVISEGYVWNNSGQGLQMSRSFGDDRMGSILSREPDIELVGVASAVLVATDGLFDPGHSGQPLYEAPVLQLEWDAKKMAEFAAKVERTGDNVSVFAITVG